ncbi:hypothetical protein [Lacticaseibacillus zhaodongensis]|uniref:hypothetical protein n=1 Tax=Lacticaseibacillus zhaodongensis TaxID=2668065 RepID=UPI0012D3032E|nr:hypothetical protein [Lacticaseibacillus zhaodongensis]
MHIKKIDYADIQGLLAFAPETIRRRFTPQRPVRALTHGGQLLAVWTMWREDNQPGILQFVGYLRPGKDVALRYGRKIIDNLWAKAKPNELLLVRGAGQHSEFVEWLIENEHFREVGSRAEAELVLSDCTIAPNPLNAGRVLTFSELAGRPRLRDDFAAAVFWRQNQLHHLHPSVLSTSAMWAQLEPLQLHDAPVAIVKRSTITAVAVLAHAPQTGVQLQLVGGEEPEITQLLPFVLAYAAKHYRAIDVTISNEDRISQTLQRRLPLAPTPIVYDYAAIRPERLSASKGE